MINPRSNFGIEVLDGTVVAVGGFNGFQATGGREDYLFFYLWSIRRNILLSIFTTVLLEHYCIVTNYVYNYVYKLRISGVSGNSEVI